MIPLLCFNYFIPFSIFHNTTKRMELFSLKRTTFVYVLSSDWLNWWLDTLIYSFHIARNSNMNNYTSGQESRAKMT